METLEEKIGILCNYIQKKEIIHFYYTDKTRDNNDWRIVEPHLVGILKSTGSAALVAWFLPTEEQLLNGESEGWRLYLVSNISNITGTGRKFQGTRPGYNPNDTRMSRIICRTA